MRARLFLSKFPRIHEQKSIDIEKKWKQSSSSVLQGHHLRVQLKVLSLYAKHPQQLKFFSRPPQVAIVVVDPSSIVIDKNSLVSLLAILITSH